MKSRIAQGFLLVLVLAAGCRKYADNPSIPNAAYIRVFNDIPDLQSPYNIGGVHPFFTFLLDPVQDAAGTVSDASVVGDFLATRQPFSVSYSMNENTSPTAGNAIYPHNYDYPGNEHVLTAPVINGFNLSAWAQITSGKHRVVMLARPSVNTGFTLLPEKARQQNNIVIDTTLDFTAGEVYTLEAVQKDFAINKYGLYVRKEDFIHRTFYSDKVYATFYNLSAAHPEITNPNALTGTDTVTISYTYSTFRYTSADLYNNLPQGSFVPVTGYDQQYFTTLYAFADSSQYLTLPQLPDSNFYTPRNVFGTFGKPDGNASNPGTLPTFQFSANASVFYCYRNPDSTNIYQGSGSTGLLASVYQFSTVNNKVNISTTVNFFEFINGQVYMMQLQRAAGNPNKN